MNMKPYLRAFLWPLLLSLAATLAYERAQGEVVRIFLLVMALTGLIASGAFLWGAWLMMRYRAGQMPDLPKPIPLPPWTPTRKAVAAALARIEAGVRWER